MVSGQKPQRLGFTLVELLIVIVVIAILAAISVVAYNNVQIRAEKSARQSEMVAWSNIFQLYRTEHDGWPAAMTVGQTYCLGTGFPIGAGDVARCRDYNSTDTGYPESDSVALMEQLKTVATLPTSKKVPIKEQTVGPYVQYESGGTYDRALRITQVFPLGAGTCPDGTAQQFANADMLWCEIILEL